MVTSGVQTFRSAEACMPLNRLHFTRKARHILLRSPTSGFGGDLVAVRSTLTLRIYDSRRIFHNVNRHIHVVNSALDIRIPPRNLALYASRLGGTVA